jgi:sulfate transport system permease protein
MSAVSRGPRWGLRSVALLYLALLLLIPLGAVFWRTFEHGISEPMACMRSG